MSVQQLKLHCQYTLQYIASCTSANKHTLILVNDLLHIVQFMVMGVATVTSFPDEEGKLWIVQGLRENFMVGLRYKTQLPFDQDDVSNNVFIKVQPDYEVNLPEETNSPLNAEESLNELSSDDEIELLLSDDQLDKDNDETVTLMNVDKCFPSTSSQESCWNAADDQFVIDHENDQYDSGMNLSPASNSSKTEDCEPTALQMTAPDNEHCVPIVQSVIQKEPIVDSKISHVEIPKQLVTCVDLEEINKSTFNVPDENSFDNNVEQQVFEIAETDDKQSFVTLKQMDMTDFESSGICVVYDSHGDRHHKRKYACEDIPVAIKHRYSDSRKRRKTND